MDYSLPSSLSFQWKAGLQSCGPTWFLKSPVLLKKGPCPSLGRILFGWLACILTYFSSTWSTWRVGRSFQQEGIKPKYNICQRGLLPCRKCPQIRHFASHLIPRCPCLIQSANWSICNRDVCFLQNAPVLMLFPCPKSPTLSLPVRYLTSLPDLLLASHNRSAICTTQAGTSSRSFLWSSLKFPVC